MKKKSTLLAAIGAIVLLAVVGTLVYFSNDNKLDHVALPQLTKTVGKDEAEVQLITSEGNINIKLFPTLAPKACENFLTLAKEGYYKNNEFFRTINNFMIQAGASDNTASGGKTIWGKGFANEISSSLYNIRGAVSLANTGAANSNGSQFFIVQNPKDATSQLTDPNLWPTKIRAEYKNGGVPSLDHNYTVFGQVISGMAVVDKIASAKATTITTASGQTENSKPVHPVSIKEVKILKDWNFKK